jgi:hypothetical protein
MNRRDHGLGFAGYTGPLACADRFAQDLGAADSIPVTPTISQRSVPGTSVTITGYGVLRRRADGFPEGLR